MNATIPKGWRIERVEHRDYLGRLGESGAVDEVRFHVIDPADEERTRTSARFDSHLGEWVVHPGSTTQHVDPDEARARAVALLAAATEVDRRNGTP